MARKTNPKKGFSIIEVMLSVFVVAVALVVIVQLMTSNIRYSIDARNRIIASELVQEGIELVINLRDNNWTNDDTDGSFGSNFPTGNKSNCRIDYDDSGMNSSSSCKNNSGWHILKHNNSSGFYMHGGSSPNTNFQRRVRIDYDDGNYKTCNYAVVTVSVAWNGSAPPSNPTDSNCSIDNKCIFAKTTLKRWGE